MLKILYGDHTFLRQQALTDLKKDLSDWQVVMTDDLTPGALEDLVLARSLFSPKQNLIFYNLSDNKPAWDRLVELSEQIASDDDLAVILIENKLDGRSKFSKLAGQKGWATEFRLPKDYDQSAAIKFILEQAERQNLSLTPALARQVFELVGPDPWDQFQAVNKLAVLDRVDSETITKYIPRNSFGNVFVVLELALVGNLAKLEQELEQLESVDVEPNQFWGLLISQALNLLALSATPSGAGAAEELGIHPYAAQKMAGLLRTISLNKLKQTINLMFETDHLFKTGRRDVWPAIRTCLVKVSQLDN